MDFRVLPGKDPKTERRLIWSLMLSLAILCTGMAWTWRVGQDSNLLFHKLSHGQDAVDALRHRLANLEGHR